MKRVTITEFRKHPDDVLKIAEKENVQITSRGKAKFILKPVKAEQALKELKKMVKVHSTNPEDYEALG